MYSNIFDRLSFISLFLVIVLLPVFCLPFTTISIAVGKGLLLVVGLTLSIIFWAISRFIDGKIIFPRSALLLSGLGIVFIFFLFSLFLVIEFFPISKVEKLLLSIFTLLSILLAILVNFPLAWILLGISSLIIFVYKVSISFHGKEEDRKQFPLTSFIVVIISLLFFLSSGFLSDVISNRLHISNTEVSPSLGATLSITRGVLGDHPIFGLGPNRFDEAWAMYKPQSINNTQFWDVSFNSGSGTLPTLAATVGGLGILSLLVFFVLFLIVGVRSVFYGIKNKVNWEIIAFFMLSLYLFISSFFYSTGAVIFLLSFVFAGVFIGLTSKEILISFLSDHRKSFFSILILILVIMISVVMAFKYIERLVSIPYFSQALRAPTVEEAQVAIGRALTLHENDLYLRTYSQIYLLKFNSLAGKDATTTSDADKVALQSNLDQAVNGALLATRYNPRNYLNWGALGSLYQSLAFLGVKDVSSKAIEAYQKAIALNPNNPGLKITLASVFWTDDKISEAKDYANQGLALKSDYIDALLLLSQIAKKEGDNVLAISYAERALALAPTNPDLIKYMDSFKTAPVISTSAPDTENP